ncbi:MlaE family lipid ABC transporter permease subunit [Myxococcota bacterium]|nr:MlaE family lipid ABC transporter permease subunit [Myxococcota bacterium]
MRARLETLGARTLDGIGALGAVAVLALQIVRMGLKPPYRLRRWVDEVLDSGVRSVLIVCLSGATVGASLSLLGYGTLSRFGAEGFLGALVGHALVRELGPVLTALLVAGRAGSAMAAEIASMVQTEQLDGLRMMSIDPVDYVITPKACSMIAVMPLLYGLFVVVALLGALYVGVDLLGVDRGQFLSSLEDALNFREHVAQGLVKALAFGVLVGLIATYRGYTSEPTSAGVSAATTGTVVTASVSILVCNYVITALWGI